MSTVRHKDLTDRIASGEARDVAELCRASGLTSL